MPFHHQLLTYANPILKITRKIGLNVGAVSPNRLRVLIYHDIPQNEEENFSAQLNWLKKSWNIVSPSEFEEMLSGNLPIVGDNVLITFDDGLISNRVVAEKILNPMNIQAVFFVISDFVEIDDLYEAREFVANYIIPGANASDIPKSWRNMKWLDLEALLEQGHTIGGHTKRHIRLSNCNSNVMLEDEIIGSADTIMKQLGNNVDHFAYTFGDIDSFTQSAMAIAKHRFRFVYSGVRGNNSKNVSPFSLRRDTAAFQRSNHEYILFNNRLLDSLIAGYADFNYLGARERLDAWS